MVSPLSLVIDVHPFFALASGLHHGAIGIDSGFLEELLRLAFPDLEADIVKQVHQSLHVHAGEAAAEITCRGRIGDASSPQGIQIGFVLATKLQVV